MINFFTKQNINYIEGKMYLVGCLRLTWHIRKELTAIGTNTNQIAHAFQVAETDSQKVFHALREAEQNKMVDERVESLLQVVTELAKKWLNDDYEKKVRIEIRLPDYDEQGAKALDKPS